MSNNSEFPRAAKDEIERETRPFDAESCRARSVNRWLCTRRLGHDGDHVAATFSRDKPVVARWSDEPVMRSDEKDARWHEGLNAARATCCAVGTHCLFFDPKNGWYLIAPASMRPTFGLPLAQPTCPFCGTHLTVDDPPTPTGARTDSATRYATTLVVETQGGNPDGLSLRAINLCLQQGRGRLVYRRTEEIRETRYSVALHTHGEGCALPLGHEGDCLPTASGRTKGELSK